LPRILRRNGRGQVNVSIEVTNDGTREAGHSVLLFAAAPSAGQGGTPLKSLVGFERVSSLSAGAKQAVTISLTAWSLARADAKGVWGGESGAWTLSASNGTTGCASVVSATVTVG
jgi:hypothetical protein